MEPRGWGAWSPKKTDWFDLSEARLQLKSYSQPMMEMAVASSRSPTVLRLAGKHGIGGCRSAARRMTR